jgi:type IV secretory pathway VirB10-like protein
LKGRQKELLLGVLLFGLVAVLWQQLGGEPAGTGGTARRGAATRTDLASLKVFPVQWASLSAPRPPYDPSGRNIFQFGAVAPPPPPPLTAAEQAAIREAQRLAEEQRLAAQRAAEDAARRAAEDAAQRAAEDANRPPPPPPKPMPPPINFKFIGYVGPPDHKIAVLTNGTDLVFARQGDEVDKGVRILEIGYESIKFGFTDPKFRGESQTLPMSSSY